MTYDDENNDYDDGDGYDSDDEHVIMMCGMIWYMIMMYYNVWYDIMT